MQDKDRCKVVSITGGCPYCGKINTKLTLTLVKRCEHCGESYEVHRATQMTRPEIMEEMEAIHRDKERLENEIDALDSELEALEELLDTLDSDLGDLGERLDTLDSDSEALGELLDDGRSKLHVRT